MDGALIIAIGICILAFSLNHTDSHWVAASTLGLGLPLLSMMLDRGKQRTSWVRLVQSVGWLLCVLTPPLLAQRFVSVGVELPQMPTVTLNEYLKHPKIQQIVNLSAGATIPVKVEVSGDLFRASQTSILPLILKEPIEIVMNDGLATGDWRHPGESWTAAPNWIHIPWIKAELTPQTGPQIRTSLVVETQHHPMHRHQKTH